MDPASTLRTAADRLEQLAGRTTDGNWRVGGLLASRPEVVAHRPDGITEHVAEARSRTVDWIVALSPSIAAPVVAWLRASADSGTIGRESVAVAETLLDRLPGPSDGAAASLED